MGTYSILYKELFSFSLEQLFYENNLCKKYLSEPRLDIEYIPTSECIDTMTRLDMVFRKNDFKAGFTVLARTLGKNMGGDHILRFSPRNNEKLSFLLGLNNPEIINFNNFPVKFASNDFFYFSNQVVDLAALRNNLHITINSAGVVGNNDITKKTLQTYRFHHTAEIVPGAAIIKHLLDGIEVEPKSIINKAGESDLVFDLLDLPPGKWQLLISGIQKDEFYYPGSAIPGNPIIVVIEISLSKALNSNYRAVEADFSLTAQRPFYKVKFINRETLWRYTITLQPNSPLSLEMASLNPPDKTDFKNRLNIVTNDSNITFTQTAASDTGFTFLSDNAVALKEKYFSSTISPPKNLSLTLKKYIGIPAKEASVKTDLPFPPNSIIDTINFPLVYSDVYLII